MNGSGRGYDVVDASGNKDEGGVQLYAPNDDVFVYVSGNKDEGDVLGTSIREVMLNGSGRGDEDGGVRLYAHNNEEDRALVTSNNNDNDVSLDASKKKIIKVTATVAGENE